MVMKYLKSFQFQSTINKLISDSEEKANYFHNLFAFFYSHITNNGQVPDKVVYNIITKIYYCLTKHMDLMKYLMVKLRDAALIKQLFETFQSCIIDEDFI